MDQKRIDEISETFLCACQKAVSDYQYAPHGLSLVGYVHTVALNTLSYYYRDHKRDFGGVIDHDTITSTVTASLYLKGTSNNFPFSVSYRIGSPALKFDHQTAPVEIQA